jgi:hypothetical protein
MNLDFKYINKQTFQCLQLPDGGIYYGELEYTHKDTNEVTFNYDDLTEEQKRNYRAVRHGYGIQLFGKTKDDNILVKYSGQWDKDKKNGEG